MVQCDFFAKKSSPGNFSCDARKDAILAGEMNGVMLCGKIGKFHPHDFHMSSTGNAKGTSQHLIENIQIEKWDAIVKRKTSPIRWALRGVILFAVIGFFLFRAYVIKQRTVVVRFKSDDELAKIVRQEDTYPCLIFKRAQKTQRWVGEIQECTLQLDDDKPLNEFEVNLRRGAFILRNTDLFVADDIPLALTRDYNSWDSSIYSFGVGSFQPYDIFPYGDRFPYTYLNLVLPDSEIVHFERISLGTSYADAVYQHFSNDQDMFHNARIRWNVDHWDMNLADGSLYHFPEAYSSKRFAEAALVSMRNPAGKEIRFTRDAKRNLVTLTSPQGHTIQFTYDEKNRIIHAVNDVGQTVEYSYTPEGYVQKAINSDGSSWSYSYGYQMKEIRENGKILFSITYKDGLVESIQSPDTGTYHFDFLYGRRGRYLKMQDALVVAPDGKQQRFHFAR